MHLSTNSNRSLQETGELKWRLWALPCTEWAEGGRILLYV